MATWCNNQGVTSGHRAHHCAKTGVSVTNAKCPYDNPHPRVYHINALIYVLIYISQIYILHIYDVTTQGTCHGYPKPLHSSPSNCDASSQALTVRGSPAREGKRTRPRRVASSRSPLLLATRQPSRPSHVPQPSRDLCFSQGSNP